MARIRSEFAAETNPAERTRIKRSLMAEFNITERTFLHRRLQALGKTPRPTRAPNRIKLIPPAIARI
jgi:hypothetical protein